MVQDCVGSAVRSTERGGDVVIILIVAKRAAAEWLLIFSNVMKKSVHTLISFVFRPAKAHRAFAGRSHGGAARDAHHHGVVCARRTEVFAIVGKNRDRWRRRSLRRRDRDGRGTS